MIFYADATIRKIIYLADVQKHCNEFYCGCDRIVILNAHCMISGSRDSMVLKPKMSDGSGSSKFKMAAAKPETVYLSDSTR